MKLRNMPIMKIKPKKNILAYFLSQVKSVISKNVDKNYVTINKDKIKS